MNTQYEIYILLYENKIKGYRLVDSDNAFTDLSVNNVPESIKNTQCDGYLKLQVYNENGVKVLRTPQEKYGFDKGFIVSAGFKSGVQWYKWYRPQFRSDANKVLSKVSNLKFLSQILGSRLIDFRAGDMDDELATYNFSFRLEQDFGEYSGMHKGEHFEVLISRWLNKSSISYTNVGCSYGDKGWFSCTIYFDGIVVWS